MAVSSSLRRIRATKREQACALAVPFPDIDMRGIDALI